MTATRRLAASVPEIFTEPVYQLGCANLDQGMALVVGTSFAFESLATGFAYSISESKLPRPSSRSADISHV